MPHDNHDSFQRRVTLIFTYMYILHFMLSLRSIAQS